MVQNEFKPIGTSEEKILLPSVEKGLENRFCTFFLDSTASVQFSVVFIRLLAIR